MDVAKLNPQQADIFAKFRDAVKDCQLHDTSDTYLLRWLVAREFDIPRAEKMLRTSLEWRKQYQITTLLEDFKPPEVFKKYMPSGFVGYDKTNNPVWVLRFGRADIKGILHSAKKKDFFNFVFSCVENSVRLSNKFRNKANQSSTVIMQSVIIFDLEHFSLKQLNYKPAIDACLQAVQFYEANYPEILRRVFVVNAPKIFSIAIALVKPFLNETTTNKIRILPGNDPSHWREAILQEIDADQFPACYGGSQTDPDGNPLCISKVNMGGPVPHSYYFNRNLKVDNSSSYKNMTVSYRAKEKLELQVDDPGSSLRWQFYSEEGDIGFGIFKRDGGAKSVVVPKDRVDCHMAPEEGEIDTEPGRYVVEFDNSYSYLRSKNIWYSITVDRPSKSRT